MSNRKFNNGLCIVYPNKDIYSETFIRNQINYINAEFEYYNGWYPYLDRNGMNILRFPVRNIVLRSIIRRLSSGLFHKIYTQQFSGLIHNNKIKVILAEYGPTGCSVMDACSLENVPLIVHFHGFDSSEFATLKKYDESYRKLFRLSKYIIVVSEVMKNELIKIGAPAGKIINNPYGVDLDFFKGAEPEKNPPVFVAVGRFAEKKAPDLTIKAFHEVYKTSNDAKLIMIGNGPLLDSCRELVKKLNINESVEFKGVLDKNEILENLKNSRAFVQHSVRAKSGDMEGTPNTVLEASAAGLPIVSTYHAGISEAVVHEKTGYLVNEHDYLSMAEYMKILLKNPELAGKMGRNARAHMNANYSVQYSYGRLLNLLQSEANDR